MPEFEFAGPQQGYRPARTGFGFKPPPAKPFVVDPCPDANEHWTIRHGNGTEHGDTERQPIATVYDERMADTIVRLLNEHLAPKGMWRYQKN